MDRGLEIAPRRHKPSSESANDSVSDSTASEVETRTEVGSCSNAEAEFCEGVIAGRLCDNPDDDCADDQVVKPKQIASRIRAGKRIVRDVAPGVEGNSGRAAVGVTELLVRAALAHFNEADRVEQRDHLARLEDRHPLTGKEDFNGGVHAILGIEDHGSRKLLALDALERKNAWTLLGHLFLVIGRFGRPRALRTDNESMFRSVVFIDPYARAPEAVHPFEAWDGLLRGYYLRH